MKHLIVVFTLVVSGLLYLSHQSSLPAHDNAEWLDANELPPVPPLRRTRQRKKTRTHWSARRPKSRQITQKTDGRNGVIRRFIAMHAIPHAVR